MSRNNKIQKKPKLINFGLKVPNNVRESLLLDTENENNLWAEAIRKEMTVLSKESVFVHHHPSYKVNDQYQHAPLGFILNVNQEDQGQKGRMVAGGHVVNSTMHQSLLSVVQIRTVRLLQSFTMNNKGLDMIEEYVGNAFVQAYKEEIIRPHVCKVRTYVCMYV